MGDQPVASHSWASLWVSARLAQAHLPLIAPPDPKDLMSVGERTLVLTFFGERIPQKDTIKQAQSLLEAQCMQREQQSSLFRAEAKQKHAPREECRHLPNEHIREVIKIMYMEQFFWVLVLLWSVISALFQYPTYLRALPDMYAHFLQDGFQCGANERSTAPIMGWCLSF